ncbi:MAG TPA: ferrous iron transport protein B [Capsulimonadaceae bacterium]|nr:ferrous iron transport protein B [Capsulimonadaceae bacterium]
MALVGNPNCGKTTVFNALTGLRQKVGNYPGVTVEKKEGVARIPGSDQTVNLIDLPGLYSLTPRSPDEVIARDVLMSRRSDTPQPEAIINVVDASNLERNLYLTSQLLELGVPMLVVLTMTDVAAREGKRIDEQVLSRLLGVPVCSVVARQKKGINRLIHEMAELPAALETHRPLPYMLPPVVREECEELRDLVLAHHPERPFCHAYAEAVTLLMSEHVPAEEARRFAPPVLEHVVEDKKKFADMKLDFPTLIVESRYAWIEKTCKKAVVPLPGAPPAGAPAKPTTSEKIDRVVLHKFWGYVLFFLLMVLIFQGVFAWAQAPMTWIGGGISWLGNTITRHMPAGDLRDLVVEGVLGGVGTTITFLPQILILFFFISLLEDTGYLARAAFLMDKVMSKVGLHGKSFIPLLSSFACAIPGIMATRTIDDRKSRLVTILVAPLMSCSARLPVYALMIGAFIPAKRVLGIFTLPGLTMIAMYFIGTFAAFGMAWVFKKTLLRSAPPRFFMELPPYHLPTARAVLMHMTERSWLFLRRAGTIILSMSVVLWALSSFPKTPGASPEVQVTHSFAGDMGRLIEPAIRPLGFDWRIGISLVTSFVAREVFVSSMGTIYSVGNQTSDPDQVMPSLQQQLRRDPMFGPLLAICIMIYYVLAMQCISTVAVVRRETGGWKWPIFQIAYMSALAWIATFLVWHVGRALGFT